MFNAHDLYVQNSKISHAQRDQYNIHKSHVQNDHSHTQSDQYNVYNITNVVPESAETKLDLLKPAARSDYYVPRCLEGTRESLFKEIVAWLNGVCIKKKSRCNNIIIPF
jgi:hypothetical protein